MELVGQINVLPETLRAARDYIVSRLTALYRSIFPPQESSSPNIGLALPGNLSVETSSQSAPPQNITMKLVTYRLSTESSLDLVESYDGLIAEDEGPPDTEWSLDTALELMKEDGIKFGWDHLQVIMGVREYYEKNEIVRTKKEIVLVMSAKTRIIEVNRFTAAYLTELFGEDYYERICRYAELPGSSDGNAQ